MSFLQTVEITSSPVRPSELHVNGGANPWMYSMSKPPKSDDPVFEFTSVPQLKLHDEESTDVFLNGMPPRGVTATAASPAFLLRECPYTKESYNI